MGAIAIRPNTTQKPAVGHVVVGALLCMLPVLPLHAADELACSLGILKHLGWTIEANSSSPGLMHIDTCNSPDSPVFKFNLASEDRKSLLTRTAETLTSVSSKCLFNRGYQRSVEFAAKTLNDNQGFQFLPAGRDPRDPFLPPQNTWDTQSKRGYDIPLHSIRESVQSLYNESFVAECSTGAQIAQLAALTSHYGDATDVILDRDEVGIGTWKQYAKLPSIAAKQPLFVSQKDRRRGALKKLADVGIGAFYGQLGYICLLYTSPSPRDQRGSRMPSSA